MEAIKIGIGRDSLDDVSVQSQMKAFDEEGIEKQYIFIVEGEADNQNERKCREYQIAKNVVSKGSVVFLYDLNCLGRTISEIEQEWRYFAEQVGCDIVVLSIPILDTRKIKRGIVTSNTISEIVLAMLNWVLENEKAQRRKLQRIGIEAAKKEGKYKGRKPIAVDKHEFAKWYNAVKENSCTARYAMQQVKIKPTTWYKLCKEYETKTERFKE